MFENINGTEHAINAGNSQSDRNDRKPMKQDRKDIPSGVVGISVNKQGSMDDPNMDILDDVEDVSYLRTLIMILADESVILLLFLEKIGFYISCESCS